MIAVVIFSFIGTIFILLVIFGIPYYFDNQKRKQIDYIRGYEERVKEEHEFIEPAYHDYGNDAL